MSNIVRETERLIIAEFDSDDSAFILRLLNTPGWLQYIGDRGIKSEADAANYIVNVLTPPYSKIGFGFWRVNEKQSGEAIGMVGLIKRDSLEDVDIGFALLPEYAGKGFAFEAALACMEFAQTELKLKRVVAITLPSNDSSIRLIEKLGLKFEKRFMDKGEELSLYGINFQ